MSTISRLRNAVYALAETRPDHIPSHFIVSPDIYSEIAPPEGYRPFSTPTIHKAVGCPVFGSNVLCMDPGTIILVAVEKPRPPTP